MKKLLYSAIALLLASSSVFAGVTVKGTWQRKSDGNVYLYRVENGRLVEMARSSTMGDNGAFGFYFQPQQASFYVIGDKESNALNNKYTFYFKTDDALTVSVNDSSYTLSQASIENKEMERWHNFLFPIEHKAVNFSKTRSTYVDFFPELEATIKAIPSFKLNKTKNATFDAAFAFHREMSLYAYANHYLMTPRTKHPVATDFPAFYKTEDVKKMSAYPGVTNYPFAVRIFEGMVSTQMKNVEGDRSWKNAVTMISNDTLRGEIALQNGAYVKTYAAWQEIEQTYGQYFITPSQVERKTQIVAEIAKKELANTKVPAIDFSYPDANGKQISLSSLKGKVVLVDVWATWCGPCKAEIPSLKALEEALRGKDIVFLGVSVDEKKDYEKWKQFVDKEGLKGTQVFASGWSEITKYYNIKGIPRFMVFNKKGEVVSIDAPRPSEPALKKMLLEEIAK
ncbi:thiol-disulfide isomerase/thioredoxin [Chitinophaga skermanii]|uniref:Thiol-disulfide isomerase/thioredoxin n=1 Tax=Chitinophaga skermanii TaxID=331697 RepID=A0A327QXK9_9BACT|nr:TlpA disulfide reductase family protein [Chitinophaga skermanii]RAJ08464.1 thiol-disulfide isomerase/thioredoxin [Chitinophaga skermanii]